MKQVISAIERQIKLEEVKCKEREMMLENKSIILFHNPLTQSNPQYLEELKKALSILKYFESPLAKSTNFNSNELSPIPLTEKWLLEFGFNKNYKKGYIGKNFSNQDFVLSEPFVMGEWQKGYAFEFQAGGWCKYKEFNFVHELLNFYFAMTDEDLLTVNCNS